MKLHVVIASNAARTAVVGKEARGYKIQLAAPPIENRANQALLKFLAHLFDLAPSLLTLVKGHTSKYKVIDLPVSLSDVERVFSIKKPH